MQTDVERLNQLVALVQRDDSVLWDPQTRHDIESILRKFSYRDDFSFRRQKSPLDPQQGPNLTEEFSSHVMVQRFLYQLLSSENDILPWALFFAGESQSDV